MNIQNVIRHFAVLLVAFPFLLHADKEWANTGTDFTDGASWVEGTAPGNERALFRQEAVTQPYLPESKTISALIFADSQNHATGNDVTPITEASGGYVFTAAPGAVLTLNNTGENEYGACFVQATTGTNIISVPLHLPSGSKHFKIIGTGRVVFDKPISSGTDTVRIWLNQAADTVFTLGADNSAFTGRLSKRNHGTLELAHTHALAGITTLEFSKHGSGTTTSCMTNSSGGQLVFNNNPTLMLNGGDGFVFADDFPLDFGTGIILLTDSNNGRDCPIKIQAPCVTVNGAFQTNGTHGVIVDRDSHGTLKITGPSDYYGMTRVREGVLLLNHADALSTNSSLRLQGHTNNKTYAGGILGLGEYGDFTLPLGTGAGQFHSDSTGGFNGNMGFAAYGADRRVNIGGDYQTVCVNSNSFAVSGVIIFGAYDADATLIFENPLELNTSGNNNVRNIYAYKGFADVAGRLTAVVSKGGIEKRGNGTLELAANNTYANETKIHDGCLLVTGSTHGSSTVNVGQNNVDNTGVVLGGTGLVGGVVNVYTNATINPGTAYGIAGTLTVTNNLTFSNDARFQLDIEPEAADCLAFACTVKKTLKFNGTLYVDVNLHEDAPQRGSAVLIDWTDAVNPTVTFNGGSFNPEDFVLVSDNDKLKGDFVVEGTTLVLNYRVVFPGTMVLFR